MQRDRVVLLVYHGQGHFNACFRIAKILANKYEVCFAGHVYFERYIRQHGFDFYGLTTVPFGLGFENWVNRQEKKRWIWLNSLRDRFTNRLFFLRQNSLQQLIDDLKPSHVVIDSWQSTDFIAMYQKLKQNRIKVALVQTMLSTIVDDTPPLTSDALPHDKSLADKARRSYLWTKFTKLVIQKLKYLGRDNESLIKSAMRKAVMNVKYPVRRPHIFSPPFAITEFILAPAEFDFPDRKLLQHQHFVGSMIDAGRMEPETQEINELITFQTEKEEPLIYCTFGSTDAEESETIIAFLLKLIPVLESQKFKCLVSTGSKRVIGALGNRSRNLRIFSHVPQMRVLTRAEVFINHGGLNSIKEGIAAAVPMLVYPLKAETDNHGNAARVVYHKLGLRGNLKNDSSQEIGIKLNTLLTNEMYRQNLRKFNSTTGEKYTAENFLSLFKKLETVE